ncbi:MAG: LytR C-terminal domain-containing protein, partial [Mycobacteriales bacterium]
PTAATPTAPSVAPVRPVVLPEPRQVRLVVLNGTARSLLAKVVGDQLAARSFVITGMGNAARALTGPSVVGYGPGGQAAAALVARHVPGARSQLVPRAARGSVTVTLGSDFQRLATPAEVAAAGRVATVPSPAPSLRAQVVGAGCRP